MRTWMFAGCAFLAFAASGCNIFEGYYYKGTHFPLGTVSERDFNKSTSHMFSTVQRVLRDRGYSIRKADQPNSESAQIWGSKNGIDYVFDVKSVGEGCQVHLEIGQAGNDGDAWSLMNDLENYP